MKKFDFHEKTDDLQKEIDKIEENSILDLIYLQWLSLLCNGYPYWIFNPHSNLRKSETYFWEGMHIINQ